MDTAIKHAWVLALCSGKYQQGREWLRDAEGKFCPVGVLCDLHCQTQDLFGLRWEREEPWQAYWYAGEVGGIPALVMAWASISETEAFVLEDLMDACDAGQSFAELAREIEVRL